LGVSPDEAGAYCNTSTSIIICASLASERRSSLGDLAPLIPVVAIVAWAAIKIARINATRIASPPSEVTARVEELERVLHGLQQELAETQERLDFAERLLAKGRS
jgi:hypothetical protein